MKAKAIKWAEAHRREALRRVFEIVATLVGEGRGGRAIGLAGFADYHDTEHRFREWLLNAFGGDTAPVDREVRRVDRLARGVWVRHEPVTHWHVSITSKEPAVKVKHRRIGRTHP